MSKSNNFKFIANEKIGPKSNMRSPDRTDAALLSNPNKYEDCQGTNISQLVEDRPNSSEDNSSGEVQHNSRKTATLQNQLANIHQYEVLAENTQRRNRSNTIRDEIRAALCRVSCQVSIFVTGTGRVFTLCRKFSTFPLFCFDWHISRCARPFSQIHRQLPKDLAPRIRKESSTPRPAPVPSPPQRAACRWRSSPAAPARPST